MSELHNEITAIADNLRGKVPNIDQLASQAILAGWSLAEFRQRCQEQLPSIRPLERPMLHDVPQKDWRNYSITRAIKDKIEGRQLSGLAAEMDQEIARQSGAAADGFWIPNQVFSRNFVAGTGTYGGMVVETSNLGDQFIEVLRNRAKVAALGARILNLSNPITIPRQAAAGVANWAASETAAATLSSGNFEQLTLTPKVLTACQQYSKQLLVTGNPSIDQIVRDDIVNIIAIAIDQAALHGAGGAVPTGIAATAGINTVALAANGQELGTTTDYPFLVSLESEIASDNADTDTLSYLVRPAHRAKLKTTQRFANTDSPVFVQNRDGSGTLNGYRAEVTNQISTALTTGTQTTNTSCIFAGVWSDLVIGQFNGGATDLVVDYFSLSLYGVVRLVARKWVDCGVRHKESFCIGGGIL